MCSFKYSARLVFSLAIFGLAKASVSSSALRGSIKNESANGEFAPRGEEKWVRKLPGLPLPEESAYPDYKMVTGYMPVSANNSRKLFYWYVESKGQPRSDPLLLWTNGGPGCSGLAGFLTEMGPFRPTSTGVLAVNPHAWTNFASMIFIEQPAGVGFSTIEDQADYVYTDEKAASDMWEFIKGFMALHPEHTATPFYLVGESYGGHYLPTTALHVIKHNKGEVNFQGFAVGNPLTDETYTNYGMYSKLYSSGLLPKPDFDAFMANECYKLDTKDVDDIDKEKLEECSQQQNEWWGSLFPGVGELANASSPGFDPYALDFAVCTKQRELKASLHGFPKRVRDFLSRKLARETYQPCAVNPIDNNWASHYLNRDDVQKAINVIGSPKWGECNNAVGEQYSADSRTASMVPVYKLLVDSGKVRIMIYSGTDDSICPLQGLQQWIWDQGYNVTQKWVPYVVSGQTGGFTSKFTDSKGAGYRITTVQGAGHMVPSTKPEQASFIIKKFLSEDW